ncbi:hypothetical protein CHLNCDRAFT_33194 [Chlorella variabilis]|uniref:Band 7 domain-containing protein n=1 Tax=Chlorella variabilis TaxID=554065 RepID=E1ZSI7_CHLVA|nr:hypothetical protein CHLNCDRAFT_33194 [Chlorella variabilis]EFN51252.1 hypothetical protein CHLNCDRAFT_33194 [Chlorella variabilis]|eukprot:XP_005843354.1 hypothetical protein CHLNCDRAFT_33194 [Chlorella variabilis]
MGNLCCTCVDQSSIEVIEQFGKFSRIAYPGFNTIWCCIGERVAGGLSLRIQQLDVRCETKTKDNVFVDVVVSVQYQVVRESLYDAFYKLTDSRSQITSYVFDEVRATVPRMGLDDVFTAKEDIARAVKEELQKSMSSFGFQIINVLVTDIEPAAKVKAAMNEINAAQRLRLAAYEQSEADKVEVAGAGAGTGECRLAAGHQDSRPAWRAIISGLRESVQSFQSEVTDVNSKEVMDLLVLTQYFDVLRDIGMTGKSNTVFLDHTPAGVANVSGQIRAGFMQANAADTQTMRR